MIDHVSVGVRDIDKATTFYQSILGEIGLNKLVEKSGTVGFGKSYPEIWLNHRPEKDTKYTDSGDHLCLRAKSVDDIDRFHNLALKLGAKSGGKPGFRPEYHSSYYACFIMDEDGNRIEIVTFVQGKASAS